MLKCAACGTENPEDFKFCENCGERIDQISCPKCLHLNLIDMKFCEECGTRLDRINCPECSHENPREFKFCEECGAQLSEQETQDVSALVNILVEKEKTKIDTAINEEGIEKELDPSKTSHKPASVSKRRKPTPKQSVPASRSRKQPKPQPVPQSKIDIAYKPRPKPEPKKPSFFKTVVLPMATKAIVRFVVSTITGFLIGKVSSFGFHTF